MYLCKEIATYSLSSFYSPLSSDFSTLLNLAHQGETISLSHLDTAIVHWQNMFVTFLLDFRSSNSYLPNCVLLVGISKSENDETSTKSGQ